MYKIISKSIIPALLLVLFVLYFSLSPSYQKSIKSKYYFLTGDYETAFVISTEAYRLNNYNKMAFSIQQQSLINMKYVDFLKETTSKYDQIRRIIAKPTIAKADKLRIKIICEVIFNQFENLNYTIITNKELIRRAKYQYDNYKELYEDVKTKL
jgi:hypothetical protein